MSASLDFPLSQELSLLCSLVLNPRLGHSQTRVTEAPSNPSLLSALWGTGGHLAAGPLSLEACQEEESKGRSRRLVWQAEHWGLWRVSWSGARKSGLLTCIATAGPCSPRQGCLSRFSFPTRKMRPFWCSELVVLLKEELFLVPGGRGVLKQMRSLDKDRSISLVTSMSSLPLPSPSLPFKTHIPSTSRCPFPCCNLSGIRMSLAIKDVSELGTPLPAGLLDPGWPGPSPHHAIIVGFPWVASGGPETSPTQLKKKCDWPEEVTSAP